ncbi:hypothetical protein [Anabaena sp. CCY 9402-a]|uniref:hypothetical protein n=1 Tax=Anabaena sp. CCY 9402-a TaxID=3103867 RepID=UPI0039C624C1
MSFDWRTINLHISEYEFIQEIISQRIAETKSQKPKLKLVFPHAIWAFIWLFLILSSFLIFVLSVISFFLKIIAIAQVYYYFIIFIISLVLIPLIISFQAYLKSWISYKKKLQKSRSKIINESEVSNYFFKRKHDFLVKYEEYIKDVQHKFDDVYKDEYVSLKREEKLKALQSRISKAVEKLELLKDEYFLRLDALELEFQNRFTRIESDDEFAASSQSHLLVESLEEQVDTINYYLQAVDEIGLGSP